MEEQPSSHLWDTDLPVDPLADTQPTVPRDMLSDYQSIHLERARMLGPVRRRFRGLPGCGCLVVLGILVLLGYIIFPIRTNILLLGIDDRAPGSAVGRSDTMILATFEPVKGYIGMLSIPRDLWVQVPGHGENRINTAHFFAEAQQKGSGPQAAKQVVQVNFGVDVGYSIRVRFDNFMQIVDAMGGIQITLTEPMSGYPAGTHRLDSDQALAFVRDRAGSDDFSRMGRAQLFLRSLVVSALSPASIPHWPEIARIGLSALETDIPVYFWPRLGLALLFTGANGIDARVISRDMVFPFQTSEGAQVLAPNWDAINPVLLEMFGQ